MTASFDDLMFSLSADTKTDKVFRFLFLLIFGSIDNLSSMIILSIVAFFFSYMHIGSSTKSNLLFEIIPENVCKDTLHSCNSQVREVVCFFLKGGKKKK